MVLLTIIIEHHQGGGPGDLEIRGEGFGIRLHLQWDHLLADEFAHFGIRVRNRTHLLTTNSARAEKIEEDRLLLRRPPCHCRLHLFNPGEHRQTSSNSDIVSLLRLA